MPALKSLDGRTTTTTSGARRWKVSAESSAITSSTVRIPLVNGYPTKAKAVSFWLLKKMKNGNSRFFEISKTFNLKWNQLTWNNQYAGIKFKQEKQILPHNRMRYISTSTWATCLRGQPLFYSTQCCVPHYELLSRNIL